jgi:hypothetical protein
MAIQPIRIGDEGQAATRELVRLLESFSASHPAPEAGEALQCLRTLEGLDRQYGGHSPIAVEGAGDVVAAALTHLAYLEGQPRIDEVVAGVALWAIRHDVPLTVVEPVANALALRSNAARSKAELSAVYGLMQGVIAHVAPRLSADLERSNPERPWRVLHANLAITAIRTEDPALMAHAFDALDRALPDECASFYAEAMALALAPRIAPAVRDALSERHRRWTQG